MILTISIEMLVYWLRGYREKDFFLVVLFINIATNLSLNLIGGMLVSYLSLAVSHYFLLFIVIFEVGIYFIELLPLSKMTENKKKIRFSVLYANLTSMIFGSLLLYIIMYIG